MKKLKFLIMTAIAAALPSAAKSLDATEALARALAADRPARMRAHTPADMTLVHTAQASEFYVFNRTNESGFLIASGDDRLRPTLAISDSGEFNIDEMPEAMRAWLDFYSSEINTFLSAAPENAEPENIFENYSKWSPITPIVTTEWNQSAPYNNLCPQVNGKACPTGCVATAMAQIIKTLGYYQGRGSNSYTPAGVGKEVSFNFESWTPDFSKMINNYEHSNGQTPTAEQTNEVATLMKACGVAVNMAYSANSSGAGAPIAGLVKYMGYDDSSTIINRADIPTAQWESLIYGQLSLGRPLYYGGSGDGAHAFVCDGYSTDGLFHINWGWGGLSNGYFALSALQPMSQGTGSFAGGYNVGQQIGIFVVPGTEKPSPVTGTKPLNLVYQQSVSASAGSGTTDRINVFHTSFSGSGSVGRSLLLVAADGSEIFMKPTGYSQINYMQGGLTGYSVDFATTDVPAGTYHAYPAFCVKNTDGYWLMQHVSQYPPLNRDDHLLLTVSETGKRSYRKADVINPGIEVFDMRTNDLYAGDTENRLYFTLSNYSSKDWIEKISMRLLDSDDKVVSTLATAYPFLPSGASVEMDMKLNISKAGTYTIRMYRDAYGDMPFGENSLRITIQSGKRPYNENKGIEPSGRCQIALWDPKTSESREIEALTIVPGETISGTTALLASDGHPFTYDIAVCARGNSYDVKWRQNLATDITAGTSTWERGHDFAITPDVAPGTYSLLFIDPYNVPMSYAADLTVCIEHEGMHFSINDDGTTATLRDISAPLTGDCTIPDEVTYGGKTYAVTAIAPRAATNCFDMAALTVPASVKSIGIDAFRGCTGLRTVTLRSAEVPFSSSVLPFYGMKPGATFYVNADAYDSYAKTFNSRGSLYGELTRIEIPAETTVKAGSDASVAIDVNTPHYNPALISAESSEPDVLTAELRGTEMILHGLKPGNATVTVNALGSDRTMTVTVSDQDAINEINAAEAAGAPLHDLLGRRVLTPRRGLYIRDGKVVKI